MTPADRSIGTSRWWSTGGATGHASGVAALQSSAGPSSASGETINDETPALFRSILDLVADAERAGFRADAERARRSAIQVYARGWDEAGRRDLAAIEQRLMRRLAAPRTRRRFGLG